MDNSFTQSRLFYARLQGSEPAGPTGRRKFQFVSNQLQKCYDLMCIGSWPL